MKPIIKNERQISHAHIDSYNSISTEPNFKLSFRSQSDLTSPPLEHKFTSLRIIHHKKKINIDNKSDKPKKKNHSSRNNNSKLMTFSTYNPSTNMSSNFNINKSNNSSKIFNNESNSISNSPSNIIQLPKIIDITGKKYINKQNYGKLLLFNNNIREERLQSSINEYLLSELYYYSEHKGLNSRQFDIAMYGRNIVEKYFDSYIKTYNQFVRNIVKTTDNEKDNNEKLLLKEYSLKNEINRLKIKKHKLLEKFFSYLSIKKFLLHVRNKALDYNKFSPEDLKQYLNDEERKELILNDYEEPKTERRNSVRKSLRRNSLLNSTFSKTPIKKKSEKHLFSSDSSKKRKSRVKEKKYEYKPIINKPIFNTVEDFESIYEILHDELAKYLYEYNEIQKEIGPLIIEKTLIQKEIQIEKERRAQLLEEELKDVKKVLLILKDKNEELNEQKKNLIKKYEINSKQIKIDNLIRDKLKDTINYINNNYKYFNIEEQLELKVIHPSLIRLKIIENVINDLSVEKQIFMTKFPIEYDKFLITSHLKEKLKNIEKKKKKEIEKQQKLIEKIIYNNNKIHIVPSRKLDLSNLKK